MEVAPVTVVGDAYIAGGSVGCPVAHHGNGERLRPRGSGDVATVAVGLLDEMLMTVLCRLRSGIKMGIELDRTQIGAGEEDG